MSSLQKFHRRTNNAPVIIIYPTVAVGSGNDSKGYCLGASNNMNLYVAPKSTELQTATAWGSYNITRGTVNTTDGLPNTNTLAGFGQAEHPAAYWAKNLTTGGYNTWYLPAIDELVTMASNRAAQPFATSNFFRANSFSSSTEATAKTYYAIELQTGNVNLRAKNNGPYGRAVRRSTI